MIHISELPKCPKCGVNWDGEDIFEHFMRRKREGDPYYGPKTEEEIKETAGMYGWSKDNPKCFREYIVGIELSYDHPQHYDGVSYWKCGKCGTTWNRWTNKEEPIPPGPDKGDKT